MSRQSLQLMHLLVIELQIQRQLTLNTSVVMSKRCWITQPNLTLQKVMLRCMLMS